MTASVIIQWRDGLRLGREEAHVEAEHRVEAELAGDDHGHGYWRFTECVREPTVEREYRNLDSECEQKCQRNPEKRAAQERLPAAMYTLQFDEIEACLSGRRAKGSRRAAAPKE